MSLRTATAAVLPVACIIATFLLNACGKDASGPSDQLEILNGFGLKDTIATTPTQGLVVRVRNEAGKPEAGVEVRFEAPTASRMLVASVGGNFGAAASAVTDAAGRATIRIQFSTRSGDGWISILVPLYSLIDTARYTVEPGAPVRVILSPRDTALTPGSSFTYRGTTVDRLNNARPDPATYEAVGTAIRVSATGVVTAESFGAARVRIRATLGGQTVTDSGTVVVVPVAQVLWSDASVTLGTLNGSSARNIGNGGLAPSAEPGGDRVVFTRSGLVVVDTLGQGGPISTPGIGSATYPEWSRDRAWIYFHGGGGSSTLIGRIRPDGTSMETLTTEPAVFPTPSPDGLNVAYINGGNIRVLDLQTRTTRTVPGVTGASNPRWSPDGAWIGYLRSDRVWIVRPDGSNATQVNDRSAGGTGIAWSPDSKWILAPGHLIDVNARISTSIPWVGQYPAWRK